MKNEINTVLDIIENNRQKTDYYKKIKIPDIEYGSETPIYKVGDRVKHNARILPSYYYVAIVNEIYIQNGFVYYVVTDKECREVIEDKLIASYIPTKYMSFDTTIRTCDLL